MEIKRPVKTLQLSLGKRTFFFDVNLAQNNKKYLKITESSFGGDGPERKRNTFLLFPEDLRVFQDKLKELAADVA